MGCKSLFLRIQSRKQFVGEDDFGDVPMNGDYNKLMNEECEEETDYVEEDLEETIGHGRGIDGGKIS